MFDGGCHAWLYYMLVVSSGSELAVADSLRMLEGFTEMMRQFPVYIFGGEDVTADECFLCLRFVLPDSYLHSGFAVLCMGYLVCLLQ